ncbi:MAG: hypothetical protein HQK99_11925 [Nitrospirae bacterium]|nr:hypothetical protein [Nitrospirota bacterium]
MKRGLIHLLVMAVILIGFAVFGVNSGLRHTAVASDTVTYWLPYLTTDTTAPIYCMLSNMGSQLASGSSNDDNITSVTFTVMSNAAGNSSRSPISFTLGRTGIPYGKSVLLSFNGQTVYSSGTLSGDLSNDTGTGTLAYYGGRLDIFGTNTAGITLPTNFTATARPTFNCSTIGLMCYQGTTSPKRNLVGYSCSDRGLFNPYGPVGGVYTY